MYNVVVNSLDNFMSKLVIDTKNDKMRDFLRYMGNQNSYFSSEDTLVEIDNTRNIWAGFAYQVFIDKTNGVELSNREALFLSTYFEQYLLEAKSLTPIERDLKGLYLKYRLNRDCPYNHVLDENGEKLHPEYEKGLKEYVKSIKGLVSLIMGEDINIDVIESNEERPNKKMIYNDKTKTFVFDENYVKEMFDESLDRYNTLSCTFEKVHAMCIEMELAKLNKVKKEEISTRALMYTLEDYLDSKASKNTKVGKAYAELFESIVANKMIDLDAREAAFDKIAAAQWLYSTAEYNVDNPLMRGYINDILITNNNAPHLRRDVRYIGGVELYEEAFSTMFNMYINGLKAMPKTKLTNVTKYFARNGNALTVLDMALIIKEYDAKIAKYMDDEEKQAELEEEKSNVKNIINYIKRTVPSYKIEEKLLKYVTKDMDEAEAKELDDEIISECISNYGAYMDVKYRVEHMRTQLDNLASSNSIRKINLVRSKEKVYTDMINRFEHIDKEIQIFLWHLGGSFEFEPAEKTVVISKKDDMNKILAAVQELMGRGIITSEKMINESIENGTPILRNLRPGFKKFAEDILAAKGVKEFKKKKNTK